MAARTSIPTVPEASLYRLKSAKAVYIIKCFNCVALCQGTTSVVPKMA